MGGLRRFGRPSLWVAVRMVVAAVAAVGLIGVACSASEGPKVGADPSVATSGDSPCVVLSPIPAALFQDAYFTDIVSMAMDSPKQEALEESREGPEQALAYRQKAAAVLNAAKASSNGDEVPGLDMLSSTYDEHIDQMRDLVRDANAGVAPLLIPVGAPMEATEAALDLLQYSQSCEYPSGDLHFTRLVELNK